MNSMDEELKEEANQQRKDLNLETNNINETLLKGLTNLKEKKVSKQESKEVTTFLSKALEAERAKNQKILDELEDYKQMLGLESNDELFEHTLKNFEDKWVKYERLKTIVGSRKGKNF
jgi:hypothetical protein